MNSKVENKNLLIIFTRNPELGKVKTRLAKGVGNQAALAIYKLLLQHTVTVTAKLDVTKSVWYSEKIRSNDIWNETLYTKYTQEGDNLGAKMYNAFKTAFSENYEKIVIIGSDLYDLTENHLTEAFEQLNHYQTVIGPAKDGGYYLLGLNTMNDYLFMNKNWGTDTVLRDTLHDLKNTSVHLLEELNDIDHVEDIEPYEIFKPFLNFKNKQE